MLSSSELTRIMVCKYLVMGCPPVSVFMAAAANGSRCDDTDDLDGHQDYPNWLIPQKRNVRFEDNRDSAELPF
jgi:hypothetical protein